MAGPTRLELATSGVTGRRSNQLNYDPAIRTILHYCLGLGLFQKPSTICRKTTHLSEPKASLRPEQPCHSDPSFVSSMHRSTFAGSGGEEIDFHMDREKQVMTMKRKLSEKSTIEEIRQRFDSDVERFSNLSTGQQATVDAPLILDLVSQVAAANVAPGGHILDLGCGAGNFTLSVLERVSSLDCVLVDLSQPMLDRARQRVSAATAGAVQTIQCDMRTLAFDDNTFDVIVAAAVLHHLRDDADWQEMFSRLYRWLRPNGVLLVADLVVFDDATVNDLMWGRYAKYLESIAGEQYREKVFDYIDQEDSPRSLNYQLDLVRTSGFRDYEVLHRNVVSAAYFARK